MFACYHTILFMHVLKWRYKIKTYVITPYYLCMCSSGDTKLKPVNHELNTTSHSQSNIKCYVQGSNNYCSMHLLPDIIWHFSYASLFRKSSSRYGHSSSFLAVAGGLGLSIMPSSFKSASPTPRITLKMKQQWFVYFLLLFFFWFVYYRSMTYDLKIWIYYFYIIINSSSKLYQM